VARARPPAEPEPGLPLEHLGGASAARPAPGPEPGAGRFPGPRFEPGQRLPRRSSLPSYTRDAMPRYVPEDSLQSPRFTGPSTFARLPYVRTLEDVDLAIVGVPFDTGVTYRVGGRFGPNAVRAASVMLRPYNANLDVKPFDVLSCVDWGDVAIVPGYIERSYAAIEAAVAPVVEAGVVPLLIGGDHACTLPHLRATRSRGPVAVIDFDSHTDAWDSYFGEKYNHGTWMRRAIEEGLVDVGHSIEVGLRGSLYDSGDWTVLRSELGLDYLTTEDVLAVGPAAVAERVRTRVGDRPAFISFDIDVVDPAFAPGTGTPEAGGPSAHDLLAVLRLLTGIDFVGFDVVEVIPAYDPAGQTATLAANLAYEMLSLVALRRLSTRR
jgi:agmatinase